MSHIEQGKTSLVAADLPALLGSPAALAKHPCILLMRQAFALVAKQYGGTVKPYYYDYRYREQQANTGLALHIPESIERPKDHALPRGVGLVVDVQTGALDLFGDPYEVDEQFYQRVQKQILQRYTALSKAAALKLMGYQVSLHQQETGRIQIAAVSHA